MEKKDEREANMRLLQTQRKIKDSDGKIVTPEAHADDTTVPFHPRPTHHAVANVPSAFSSGRAYVYARIRRRLLELRICALCSSSGKTLSVGRQWEELSNADICSNVPRAVTERRGEYRRVPLKLLCWF